jgi:anti-sigma regulatory factor (Ser/Thr protein kinase)
VTVKSLVLLAVCGVLVRAHERARCASGTPCIPRRAPCELPTATGQWPVSVLGDCGPGGELKCVAAALPADRREAPRLRGMVRETLHSWQLHHVVEDALLVGGELFANAIIHGSSGCDDLVTIELRHFAEDLYVAVTDHAPDRDPVLREAGDDDEHGRGMRLVDQASMSWAVERHGVTKTVWALLSTKRAHV